MEKLHWGRKYLSHEYGDDFNVDGGFYGTCNHMFKSLCAHDQRIQDNWWKDHGWSHEGSDLIHAAHYEERQEQAFHEAVSELHNKIVDHRMDRKEWARNRTEYLAADAADRNLDRRKKAYLQKEEDDNTIADYGKDSATINAGLVHKMGEDSTIAYGSYGSVEAQAAEEEIQEMADWHALIESMRRSGKTDPLYIKQVEAQGAAMMSVVKQTMLRLHDEVKEKHDMAKKDQAEVTHFEQQQMDREKIAERKQREFSERDTEEESEAESASQRLLSRNRHQLAGIGQARHTRQEETASEVEAKRQREMRVARQQAIEVKKDEEASLKMAREKSKEEEQKLKQREEAEAKKIAAARRQSAARMEQEHQRAEAAAAKLLQEHKNGLDAATDRLRQRDQAASKLAAAVEARRAAAVKSAEEAEQNQAMAEKAEDAAGKLAKDAYSGAKHLAAATAAVSGVARNVLVHKAEAAAEAAGLERAYGAQGKTQAQQHLHALAQARVAKSQISQHRLAEMHKMLGAYTPPHARATPHPQPASAARAHPHPQPAAAPAQPPAYEVITQQSGLTQPLEPAASVRHQIVGIPPKFANAAPHAAPVAAARAPAKKMFPAVLGGGKRVVDARGSGAAEAAAKPAAVAADGGAASAAAAALVKKSQTAPSVKVSKPGAIAAPQHTPHAQALQLHRVQPPKGTPTSMPEAVAAASKVPVFAYDPATSAKSEEGPVALLQAIAKNSIHAAKTKGVELKAAGKTPWGQQTAFMAALRQQMVNEGDADM